MSRQKTARIPLSIGIEEIGMFQKPQTENGWARK
jgi:hypothetical protein